MRREPTTRGPFRSASTYIQKPSGAHHRRGESNAHHRGHKAFGHTLSPCAAPFIGRCALGDKFRDGWPRSPAAVREWPTFCGLFAKGGPLLRQPLLLLSGFDLWAWYSSLCRLPFSTVDSTLPIRYSISVSGAAGPLYPELCGEGFALWLRSRSE